MDKVMFYMAHVSLGLIVVMFFIVIKFKTRTKLTKYFIAYLVELFLWTASVVAEGYFARAQNHKLVMIFENLTYAAISMICVTVLLLGLSFNASYKKRRILPYLLFTVPVITQLVLWFFPKLFYIEYEFTFIDYISRVNVAQGWYFWVHTVYSYFCLLLGMILIIRFAINSRGNSRWQAIIIIFGSAIPLLVNIGYTLGVPFLSIFSTPIAFMITILSYIIGVFRFNLLRATPLALRTILDKISDLYVVIDENMRILDYNEPFAKTFGQHGPVKKNMGVRSVVDNSKLGATSESFAKMVDACREIGAVISKDFKLSSEGKDKYYTVEFTPLAIDKTYCGCILLLRDVTQAKNDMEEIKRNQNMLIERERLASLGHLMGGIAHNLKTPIMAVSGRLESIRALVDEFEESLDQPEVTREDYAQISQEIRTEMGKIKTHMSYISDIISAVKDQTVKFNTGTKEYFTVGQLINRITILLQHELISHNCELSTEILVGSEMRLSGDIISLIQILDNIIINAIHAYRGAKGLIKLKIWKANGEIFISIADTAGGIKKEVQEKLFKKMVTTKGTDGTGLGLYISHATVVGMFGGKMKFSSIEGAGTEFLITLPIDGM